MKRKSILIVFLLLLCEVLSAQSYHYQYAHDTLGNRVSRVYQGIIPSKGNNTEQDSLVFQAENVIIDDTDELEESVANQYADKDTTKHSPLVKTQAEKEAYLDSMMAAVLAQVPFHDDEGDRFRPSHEPIQQPY